MGYVLSGPLDSGYHYTNLLDPAHVAYKDKRVFALSIYYLLCVMYYLTVE